MYYENEQYNESLASLQQAAKLAPKDGKINYQQGLVYRRLNQADNAKNAFEQAVKNYQAAVKADKTDDVSFVGLGQAYDELNRNDEALDAYSKATIS